MVGILVQVHSAHRAEATTPGLTEGVWVERSEDDREDLRNEIGGRTLSEDLELEGFRPVDPHSDRRKTATTRPLNLGLDARLDVQSTKLGERLSRNVDSAAKAHPRGEGFPALDRQRHVERKPLPRVLEETGYVKPHLFADGARRRPSVVPP